MDVEECWKRLHETDVGRLGVTIRGHPFIFPVNYTVFNEGVAFGTDDGLKLDGVLHGPSVVFEVDHVDITEETAWSVAVAGPASLITNPDQIAALDEGPAKVWDPGPRPFWVHILAEDISGRRVASKRSPETSPKRQGAN